MTPLIFFVHIPKTAGSTINAVLRQYLPNGFDHCEAFIADRERLRDRAGKADWLSGHVDFDTARIQLSCATARPVRFFSCMRSPADQVMSHYNWLIEIFHRGREFYEAHPLAIKTISETIRSSPAEPESIIGNLERFAGLFRNVQSRLLLGNSFDWNKGLVLARLSDYEMIGESENLKPLARQILGRSISDDGRVRENVSRYHFDSAIVKSSQMSAFLSDWNLLDEVLYGLLAEERRIALNPPKEPSSWGSDGFPL